MHIQPLDIILFRGTDIVSFCIRKCEQHHAHVHAYNCDIIPSHVGIVVSRDLLPHVSCMKPSVLYLLESTITYGYVTSSTDIIDGVDNGVQLRELKCAIDAYCNPPVSSYDHFCAAFRACPPAVYWCKLINNPWKTAHARRIMTEVYDLLMGCGYDLSFVQQLGSVFTCMQSLSRNITSTSSNIFCSQLIAIVLDQLGVCRFRDVSCVCPIDFLHLRHRGKPVLCKPQLIHTCTTIY